MVFFVKCENLNLIYTIFNLFSVRYMSIFIINCSWKVHDTETFLLLLLASAFTLMNHRIYDSFQYGSLNVEIHLPRCLQGLGSAKNIFTCIYLVIC